MVALSIKVSRFCFDLLPIFSRTAFFTIAWHSDEQRTLPRIWNSIAIVELPCFLENKATASCRSNGEPISLPPTRDESGDRCGASRPLNGPRPIANLGQL